MQTEEDAPTNQAQDSSFNAVIIIILEQAPHSEQ